MTEKEINSFYSSLARTDGVLRGIFVSHPAEITKSDCFIFVINRQVLLNDAGMTGCTDAIDRLVRIRGEVNPGGKLGITWILSHFHVDHVAAAIETLIPDERFSFNDVYLPPLSKLDPKYEGNGDTKYRERLADAIARYQPQAKIHHIPFFTEWEYPDHFDFGGAKVTVYPPERDWSSPECVDIIVNGYFGGAPGPAKVATCVINASSLWFKLSYAGKTIVMTGDSMKREKSITNENFDMMLKVWGRKFRGADLFKWPHHGMARDNAAAGVAEIAPSHILTSTAIETASKVTKEEFPEFFEKTVFHNCALSDVYLTVEPNGDMTFYED
ncbi:MAG: hypothetical protein ILO42_04620 [Clostridia bacterium]|nr:hypothetical protein [Clostridia bacterium]